MTLEADGESHLPRWCCQELILMQSLKDSPEKKKERKCVYSWGKFYLEVTLAWLPDFSFAGYLLAGGPGLSSLVWD